MTVIPFVCGKQNEKPPINFNLMRYNSSAGFLARLRAASNDRSPLAQTERCSQRITSAHPSPCGNDYLVTGPDARTGGDRHGAAVADCAANIDNAAEPYARACRAADPGLR
jgi:hypothetical protein